MKRLVENIIFAYCKRFYKICKLFCYIN